MIIGLIVEGDDDYQTYPSLIRKCRQDIDHIYRRQCGGRRRLKTKFIAFLKEFQSNPAIDIDKVLVIRDSDWEDSRKVERDLEQILQRSGFKPTFAVHFHATKCMLESLLLADEDAVRRVAIGRGKQVQAPAPISDPESAKEAKTILSKRLWQATLPFNSTVLGELAMASDLDKLITICPYFRHLIEITRAC